MPTPFTHLASAQRLLSEDGLPAEQRTLLHAELPAFLLGTIAADGHSEAGLRREETHFYSYDRPIHAPLAATMLARHPRLNTPASPAQRACIAGYIGHLALDEVWTEAVMRPHFIEPAWADGTERFLMLNLLLIGMDERDRGCLQPALGTALDTAVPAAWLPFLPDPALRAWRDVIARQLAPGGASETLPIISARTGLSTAELRSLADSQAALDQRLWAHVPIAAVHEAEARMQAYAAEQVSAWLGGG